MNEKEIEQAKELINTPITAENLKPLVPTFPQSAYWEDSPLRGSTTEHQFITGQRMDHKCAVCGMNHREGQR